MTHPARLVVCTFNVHGWTDAWGDDNLGRVIRLLRRLQPDVVALQEVTDEDGELDQVLEALGMEAVVARAGYGANALLVRGEPERPQRVEMYAGPEYRSAALATVQTPAGPVTFCATHLDYRLEADRVEQLQQIVAALGRRGGEAVVMGDFNALRRADYEPERFREMVAARRDARIEPARGEVMDTIDALGWVDLVRLHDLPGSGEGSGEAAVRRYRKALRQPLSEAFTRTSAYETRVDYLWATPGLARSLVVPDAHVVDDGTSDHAAVVLALEARPVPERPAAGAARKPARALARRENPWNAQTTSLRDYLNLAVDGFDFPHRLEEFFRATGSGRVPRGFDPDASYEWLSSPAGQKKLKAFEAWLIDHALKRSEEYDHAESPSYLHYSGARIVPPSTWLVHFSEHARDIARDGFRYGHEDLRSLALTTYFADRVRYREPGWNFGLKALSRDASSVLMERKYGSDRGAVLFQCAGVEAWHSGDEEHQVIFWGPLVREVILLERDQYGEGLWSISDRHTGRVLKEGTEGGRRGYESVVQWAMDHRDQYRRRIVWPVAP